MVTTLISKTSRGSHASRTTSLVHLSFLLDDRFTAIVRLLSQVSYRCRRTFLRPVVFTVLFFVVCTGDPRSLRIVSPFLVCMYACAMISRHGYARNVGYD